MLFIWQISFMSQWLAIQLSSCTVTPFYIFCYAVISHTFLCSFNKATAFVFGLNLFCIVLVSSRVFIHQIAVDMTVCPAPVLLMTAEKLNRSL